jgi:hemerythrin superfamily protein
MAEPNTAGAKPGDGSDDVVSLLKNQHDGIRRLFNEVEAATGDSRKEAFQLLTRVLVVHETAEEEVVHPYVRSSIEGGDKIVADRLKEEEKATRVLNELEDADPNSPEFIEKFTALRNDVLQHAEAEETQEFSRLREGADPRRLELMAKAVRAAEAIAPTRPHPTTAGSPAKNLAFGPLAAVMDRTRDAIRQVMHTA